MKLTVRGPDDLIAALPHLLGFTPEESLVLVPFTSALPVARVDLPRDDAEREEMVREVSGAVLRHAPNAGPDATLAVVCISADRNSAERAAEAIARGLSPQLQVPIKLWADERRWTDLETGQSGPRSSATVSRLDAEMVASGRQMPAANRENLHAALIGDRAPVAMSLPAAHGHWQASSVDAERRWVINRVDRFLGDGISLSDADAARLLVAVHAPPVRDAAWALIGREDNNAHRALWADMTRRAPDEVRTPAATLLAFSAWLGGDGAGAWVALDQIPEEQHDYRLATLVAGAVQGALHPSEWEQVRPDLLAESSATNPATRPTPEHNPGVLPGVRPDATTEQTPGSDRTRRPAPPRTEPHPPHGRAPGR